MVKFSSPPFMTKESNKVVSQDSYNTPIVCELRCSRRFWINLSVDKLKSTKCASCKASGELVKSQHPSISTNKEDKDTTASTMNVGWKNIPSRMFIASTMAPYGRKMTSSTVIPHLGLWVLNFAFRQRSVQMYLLTKMDSIRIEYHSPLFHQAFTSC